MPIEKRVDPEDGSAYTYEDLAAYYKGKYKRVAIDAYWETCTPVKKSKGKGKGKGAAPEPKAKAKAKVKVKAKAKAKVKREAPSIKLTYFGIEGAAEKVRLALVLGKIPFEDDRINRDEWQAMKPTTKFGQLPIMTIGDGEPIAQSGAMLRYCGRLARLSPPHLTLKIEEAIGLEEDLARTIRPSMAVGMSPQSYGHPADISSEAKTKIQMDMRAKLVEKPDGGVVAGLGHLEKLLGDGPYMCGNKFPTIADCQIIPRLRHFKKGVLDGIPATILDDYPKLTEYNDRFHAIPEVKEYYDKLAAK